MQIVLALYFLFAAIYWSGRFIEWVLRTIGILEKPYRWYSFEEDVLKPLGYNYVDYRLKPDIGSIFRVQKKLSAELLKRIQEPDWRSVQRDLDENQKMEEEFIENLKKAIMTRILIIEDDTYTQQLIEASICGPGQYITAVSDGDEAMRLLLQEHFDFVLTDLFHPGLFGLEIVSKIRGDASLRAIGIGVISGHANGEMATEAQRRGADFVMAKPFDPKLLREKFERINCRSFKKTDIEKPCPCVGILPKYRFLHGTIIGDLLGEIIIVILWRCNTCGMFRCERRIVPQGQIPLRLELPED